MAVAIQFRHDDAAVWLEEDPILLEGEVGVELDTDLFKIGDGETLWHNLPYANRGLTGEKGDKGDKGDTGATGAPSTVPGPAGADGRTVLNGAGAPGSGTGVNGDFYINLSAITIYGPKTGGAWGSPTSIIGSKGDKGDQGETGTAGFTLLNGTGVPGVGLGVNGDFYIDTTNKTLYGPKTGGAWGSLTSLIGDKGDKGDQGDRGYDFQHQWTGTVLGVKSSDEQNFDEVDLKGDKGDMGDAATIAVGTVTPVPYGNGSAVANVGTEHAAVLNFALETGEKGDQGDKGDKGDDGVDGTMILSGTGDPPSPSGLADGTIYIKYTA